MGNIKRKEKQQERQRENPNKGRRPTDGRRTQLMCAAMARLGEYDDLQPWSRLIREVPIDGERSDVVRLHVGK